MDYTDRELQEFISRHLAEHADLLVRTFQEQLQDNRNVRTGTLVGSISRLPVTQGSGGISVAVELPLYGRFMEIRGRRRQRARRSNRDAWASRNHRAKKTQWYNRNRYAGYGRLVRTLSAGISEHELQEIRNVIAASGLPAG